MGATPSRAAGSRRPSRSTRGRVADLLTHALADAPGPLDVRPGDADALVAAAATHRVGGYVHRALRAAPGPAEAGVAGRVAAMATRSAAHHLAGIADLARLARILDGEQVRWCTMKGPVVAEVLHGGAGLRGYGDLDVLVAPDDLLRVVTLLEDAGAQVIDRHWRTLLAWRHTQLHLRLWASTTLDLHWHLLNEWYDRDAFSFDTDTLLAGVHRVQLDGVQVPTLGAADTLIHLCVHAAVAGGQRLMWLRDIQLAARSEDVDWQVVGTRAAATRTRLVTATMLTQAGTALGDAHLRSAGRQLSPNRMWTGVAGGVARVSPPARWRGDEHLTLGWALCRSTRQTAGRSLWILLAHVPRLLRRWITTPRVRAAVRSLVPQRAAARDRTTGRALPDDGPEHSPAYHAWVRQSVGHVRPPGSGRATPSPGDRAQY